MPSVIRGNTLRVDLTDLRAQLKSLGKSLGQNVMRRAILAGMNVIRTDARARVVAPRKGAKKLKKTKVKRKGPRVAKGKPPGGWPVGTWSTGRLKKSIVSDTKMEQDASGTLTQIKGRIFIGKPMKAGAYNKAVAASGDGVVSTGRNARRYAHLVEFGAAPHTVGKLSRLKKKGRRAAAQFGIMHPGHAPRPFMRPAWDTKQAEAAKQVETVARRELAKEIAAIKTKPNKGK